MLYVMSVRIPIEAGNAALSDPDFGTKMQDVLRDIKAQAAYFTTMGGQRGGYIIVDLADASQIPGVAEPFFLWLKADVTFQPAMRPEDLAKAGPGIAAAVKKWG